MLKINGVVVKTPKTFSVDISDIDGETNRNANGDMNRDRITTKRKLNCAWGPLKNEEISIQISLPFFNFSYRKEKLHESQS